MYSNHEGYCVKRIGCFNRLLSYNLQRLEEKAKAAEEKYLVELNARKDLELLNAKLLTEKQALLSSLAGEKGSLQEYQERCSKLTAQKNDLDNQLRVSLTFVIGNYLF